MNHHADRPDDSAPGQEPGPPHGGRPPHDHTPNDRRAHDRPAHDPPPLDPPPHDRPAHDRPAHERPRGEQPRGAHPRWAHPPRPRPYLPPGWRPPYMGPPLPPVPPGTRLPPVPFAPLAPPVPPPAPPPPFPAAVPDNARGVIWAFVPFITLGYGTPFSFLYAAIRRGSWSLGATAAGYGVGTAAVLTMLQVGNPFLVVLATFLGVLLWIAGTGHAFAVRSKVFPGDVPRNRRNQHAIEVARYRRSLRDEARALAAEDPALARELRIGRPDLPRAYDDGGLVDVNHAPREILAALPGMTPELADRVVRVREERGGFVSAEEMAVDADIPPDVLPLMADYTIFLK